MAKLFVAADIHSYFDIFKNALDKAGYDPNNENHWLILLGDCFDRGPQSIEMYDFLKNRNERTIMVAGNHDDLIIDCLERGFFGTHDVSNGTVRTILDLAGKKEIYDSARIGRAIHITNEEWEEASEIVLKKLSPLREQMIDYFETENYIFVHSWIPIEHDSTCSDYWSRLSSKLEYSPTWRTPLYPEEWKRARWHNPFSLARQGLNKTGKTIVFGHWHTSWYRATYENGYEFGDKACFDIVKDEENNIIGIDASTAASKQCNILVLEDNFL